MMGQIYFELRKQELGMPSSELHLLCLHQASCLQKSRAKKPLDYMCQICLRKVVLDHRVQMSMSDRSTETESV